MKTEIELTEAMVFEESAALGPLAKVTLPALGHKMAQAPAKSLENLRNLASRISNLRPTAKTSKGINNHRREKTVTRAPKIGSGKSKMQKIYERASQAFD